MFYLLFLQAKWVIKWDFRTVVLYDDQERMSYYAECNLFNYSFRKRTASERIVRRELFKLLYHYQSVVLIMKKYNFMHKEFDEREREKIVTYSSHLRNLSQGVLVFTLLVGKIVYRTTHDLLIDSSKFSLSLHVYLVECLMLVISTISMQSFLISLRSFVHRILSIVIPYLQL